MLQIYFEALFWNSKLPLEWAGLAQSVSASLRAEQSVDRVPVGARFSAHFQIDPRRHPTSSTMVTGSF
jgi:hypothetical protein